VNKITFERFCLVVGGAFMVTMSNASCPDKGALVTRVTENKGNSINMQTFFDSKDQKNAFRQTKKLDPYAPIFNPLAIVCDGIKDQKNAFRQTKKLDPYAPSFNPLAIVCDGIQDIPEKVVLDKKNSKDRWALNEPKKGSVSLFYLTIMRNYLGQESSSDVAQPTHAAHTIVAQERQHTFGISSSLPIYNSSELATIYYQDSRDESHLNPRADANFIGLYVYTWRMVEDEEKARALDNPEDVCQIKS
jgi:hypothetical protein